MIKTSRFYTVFILFLVVAVYLFSHADVAVPMNRSFSEFPRDHAGWRMVSESFMSSEVQRVLKATDYLSRQYVSPDGKTVSLYVGYHSGGKDSGGIHSPKHCLPGSGWFEMSSEGKALSTGSASIKLVKAVYQKGSDKQLFLYWFQVRDKFISNEYDLKLQEIINSAMHGRRDSAFIRVTVPFENDETVAAATGEGFVRDFLPLIRSFLPS